MLQPRPHGLTVVGGELTADDAAFIELLARRLTNIKHLSGVASLRMVRTLPDGGFVIAQDMGGVFKVIATKTPEPQPSFVADGLAKSFVPMLFSGVITKALLFKQENQVGIRLTDTCRRRLVNYDTRNLPPKNVLLQRFNIEYADFVREFVPNIEINFTYTQYVAQRPTWYSGAMAEVMQIVGGYGRQDLASLPTREIEQAKFELPTAVTKAIEEELDNLRLPGFSGFPDIEGKFQYDYKHARQHAVGFDQDNKPWLMRVDARGVYAMPLPIIPATRTEAFRAYVEEKGDDELLAILDRFGAMPSGEGFPVREAFEAWRRAGVIVKVCDSGTFYTNIAYSTTMGFSFNSKGTEGFATCYNYGPNGVAIGLAYKLKINWGSAKDGGFIKPQELPADNTAVLNYLGDLFALLDDRDPEHLAIKYKVRRVPVSDLESRSKSKPDSNEVDYWNNLEVDPIAIHSGTVTESGRGNLFDNSRFDLQPQIKFPEPFLLGCASFDFSPTEEGRNANPRCDTIMVGYYIGDDLKTVKYFRDPRGFNRKVESTFEDCMIVGSWDRTETSGESVLQGRFYTSDMDDRDVFAPVETTTSVKGRDLGWGSTPAFAFDGFFERGGTLWRSRYYSTESRTESTNNRKMELAICVPYYNRNAVLYAKKDTTSGGGKTHSLSRGSVMDPTTYRFWTNHPVFAWRGGIENMNGKPSPKDGNPVWVEVERYSPGGCSDFADYGTWIPGMPADYTWLIHPNKMEWKQSGGGGAPPLKAFSISESKPSSEKGGLWAGLMDSFTAVHSQVPYSKYFLASPDSEGDAFYVDACKNLFGATNYGNVSEIVDGARKRWGYCSLVDHKYAYHFIGVINE